MVARIKIGRSVARGFYYNEHKVKYGAATCLMAENFPASLEEMSQFERLNVLQKVTSLNPNVKTSSVHISLNFSPGEQLSDERLREIASDYMQRIGFAGQPYLVYRHYDAGHPHIHIVSTRIGFDGRPINVHNIGKRLSEPARKEIEIKYELVRAEDQPKKKFQVPSAYTSKAMYGTTESKKAIESVLNGVLHNYRYSSLPELNAVLKQYNVVADPGTENSRTFRYGGLHYKILDNAGRPVGVPIKASALAGCPTLKWLEQRFRINGQQKEQYKKRTQNTIDYNVLARSAPGLRGLTNALQKDGVILVLRTNKSGLVYGVTYVDHRTRCVFNGSELGKNYSAKAIMERCQVPHEVANLKSADLQPGQSATADLQQAPFRILEDLMQQEYTSNYVPYELSGKKKKKQGRRK